MVRWVWLRLFTMVGKRMAFSLASALRLLAHGVDLASDLSRHFPDRRGDLIFDVGANVGQTVLEFRTVFRKAYIVSFEPDSDFFWR